MSLIGNCQTTAMGILPHTDADSALELALSLDIPFWPQLPKLSFYEDMYVQVSQHFPGITIDPGNRHIDFSRADFDRDLMRLVDNWDDLDYYRLSNRYSQTFESFLQCDLRDYRYIRGQVIGPISFGLSVTDEDKRPIIYDNEVKQVLFPFIQRKIEAQWKALARVHPEPLVWIDEPGLESLFSAFTGYTSTAASGDYREFLADLPGPRGIHLCGNPDWSFLLQLDLDVISMDALAHGHLLVRYFDEFTRFLDGGGIICWGLVPTAREELERTDEDEVAEQMQSILAYLSGRGVDGGHVLSRSWLAPARCCLINDDGTASVERSIRLVQSLSDRLRDEYDLGRC